MSEAPSKHQIVYPQIPAIAKEKVASLGLRRCRCFYYTTNNTEKVDGYINHILHAIDHRAFVVFERWSEQMIIPGGSSAQGQMNNQRWHIHWESRAALLGDYLILCIPFSEDDKGIELIGHRCAALLRVFFGDLIAKELHFSAKYEIAENQWKMSYWSNSVYVYPFYNHTKTDFTNSRDGINFALSLRPRALDLLHSANEQTDTVIRFILLWLTIEAQFFDEKGGGGKRRQRFALETLGSEIINGEVMRLFQKRNECMKEVKKIDVAPFDEFSIFSFIRLGMLNDCPLRKALTRKYEMAIQNPELAVKQA